MIGSDTLDRLERLGKVSALAIVAIYVVGYLVTSLYFSSFGLADFNPLKTRVVGAGLLLTILSSAAYAIGVTSSKLPIDLRDHQGINSLIHYTLSLSQCLATAEVLTNLFLQMTDYGLKEATQNFCLMTASIFLIIVGYTAWRRKTIPTMPERWIAALSAAAVIGIFLWFYIGSWGHGPLGIAAWLGLISISVCGLRMLGSSRSLSPGMNVVSLAAELVFFITTFTNYVYPHFRPEWGGGAPIRVTMSFNKDAGGLAGRTTPALLLDESDLGFYLIDENTKHTYFVPRASVSLLDFPKPQSR
ncbi:MAG: hypothetical protein WBY53_09835 [Acidobacteriaceae bacterium]